MRDKKEPHTPMQAKHSSDNGVNYVFLCLFSAFFLFFGFTQGTPSEIVAGLSKIIQGPDRLITDYIALGGMGAAFVNAGLAMLVSVLLLYVTRAQINGTNIAAVFLMGGFALFGKNILNIWPVIGGVYLYARIRRVPFRDYIHIALFGTSMAPVVSEFFFAIDLPVWQRVPLGLLLTLSIGFLLTPLSRHMYRIHKGFNLYNIGFTVGIMGTVYVSVFKSFGYDPPARLLWSEGNNLLLGLCVSGLFVVMAGYGLYLHIRAGGSLSDLRPRRGPAARDLVEAQGLGIAMLNMSLCGLTALCYVLLVGGPLNGPTLGGILTVAGFGAAGKRPGNITPVLLGVALGSFMKSWNINDPPVLLAALFGTSLAPIASHYGWIWGIVAGWINSSVALNSGVMHAGLNLYNTGFSAGIVAAVMVPALEAFHSKKAASADHP